MVYSNSVLQITKWYYILQPPLEERSSTNFPCFCAVRWNTSFRCLTCFSTEFPVYFRVSARLLPVARQLSLALPPASHPSPSTSAPAPLHLLRCSGSATQGLRIRALHLLRVVWHMLWNRNLGLRPPHLPPPRRSCPRYRCCCPQAIHPCTTKSSNA
jgi:hypothetical protein